MVQIRKIQNHGFFLRPMVHNLYLMESTYRQTQVHDQIKQLNARVVNNG